MATPRKRTASPAEPKKVDLTPYPVTANKCQVCDQHIATMAFKGTGVCSMLCKKKRDGDS